MFITAVCVLFLIKLRWPRNKSLYHISNCCRGFFRKSHQIWKQNERCELQEYNGICIPAVHIVHGLMNSISWAASSVWVFTAQLVQHCSANAEATGSYPVEAPKKLFFGLFRNCLNCHSLRWSHIHFKFGSVCFNIRKDCKRSKSPRAESPPSPPPPPSV